MLDVHTARDLVLKQCCQAAVQPVSISEIPLLDSFRRVLAEDIILDRDQPPFNRSMRDGFALRSEDLAILPATLSCVGEVKAGEEPSRVLEAGQAIQIMTGSPVPVGANAVVMIENTERISPTKVRVLREVRSGENIAVRGSERQMGCRLMKSGQVISFFELSVLAAVGRSSVKVFRQPAVSILPTGDELVNPDQIPGPAQIRNTNSSSLYALTLRAGARPRLLEIAKDSHQDLRRKIQDGLQSDVLVLSGGVSMGNYDLVESALLERGAEILFNSVSIRPGKPTVFARLGDRWIFGLPGNPVSAFVTFEVFVRPVLRHLQGLSTDGDTILQGRLLESISDKSGRTSFLPARVTHSHGVNDVLPLEWKGSADIFSLIGANAFAIVPREVAHLEQGSSVDVLMFSELQFAHNDSF